jgi:hypothetical protein
MSGSRGNEGEAAGNPLRPTPPPAPPWSSPPLSIEALATLDWCGFPVDDGHLLWLEAKVRHHVSAFIFDREGTLLALESGLGIFIAERRGFLVIRLGDA